MNIFKRILDLEKITGQEHYEIEDKINKQRRQLMEDIIKNYIFSSLIYVSTPSRKVVTLPFGSTVLDFVAYKIHSELREKLLMLKLTDHFLQFNYQD